MRNLIVVLIALVLAAVSFGNCLADEDKKHVCFRVLDVDKDGEVTLEEFEKYFGKESDRFKSADVDKNGTLSHDEYHEIIGGGAS